ncbi:WD40-repeat-containing domain protein, partial [Cantharellus anzutake]|uniref:WD40-repeat-containing domain protein n=1 Tax=Cantharellus anzutake TaxID=1750568 RepID=UPI001907DE94
MRPRLSRQNAISSQGGNGQTELEPPEDFFSTEFGPNALHAIKPIEENHDTDFATGRPPPLIRTSSTFSDFTTVSAFSTFSNGSTLSVRSSGGTCSLKGLCEQVIDKHLWLQTARIISTSCYSQYRSFVLHRFLIFQLRRPEKKDIWLRIDRRAGLNLLSLARKLGKTRANDTAQLSASEKVLAGRARRENIQEFQRPPFLGDFGAYLRIICEELMEYKVWPENCWMFCSLLQDYLEISGDGRYTFGGSVARSMAPLIRGKISELVGTHVTPNTIMAVLQSSTWTFSPLWQPLNFAKPNGWLSHSIGTFLSKIAYPSQGAAVHHHPQGVMEWIASSSLAAHLEKSDLHSHVALHCIDILCRLPEENILQLPNPLILNSVIPDLAFQIQSKISPDVQYAALYGLLHVAEIENPSMELFNKLEAFLAESVLKWLEVLSLLGATKNVLVELDKIAVWCENHCRQLRHQNRAKSLLQLLLRSRCFAYHYYGVISASAGHISHSALSHSPDTDWLRQYRNSSRELLPIVQGQDSVRDGWLNTIRGHTRRVVNSVSFSPDGSRIASAPHDETVRIWDAVTGEELKVFQGHTKWVNSVTFSSDGSRVASASGDKTVRIWDAVTGEELRVLRGHTDWVRSVSFSGDGSRIASASDDETVQIWDAVTGEELKVLRGHTKWVNSVSFSSDGSRVASASTDKTVRIWDAMTGGELKVLQGHSHGVNSVSFSSDGSMVASASGETVRIWDAVTGEERKVFRGHTKWVNSISFSSDGSRVASASGDQTIRVWDVMTGEELKVFEGHTHGVNSVSFSPDGSRIASASGDET